MEHHIEDLLLEPVPVTGLALEHEVGHELHLNGDHSGSFTLLTASTLGVEREILGCEAHLLRQGLFGEEVADGIVGLDIGGGIGTGRLADGILVDELHMLDGFGITGQSEIFARGIADLSDMSLERRIEDALDQTGLP